MIRTLPAALILLAIASQACAAEKPRKNDPFDHASIFERIKREWFGIGKKEAADLPPSVPVGYKSQAEFDARVKEYRAMSDPNASRRLAREYMQEIEGPEHEPAYDASKGHFMTLDEKKETN